MGNVVRDEGAGEPGILIRADEDRIFEGADVITALGDQQCRFPVEGDAQAEIGKVGIDFVRNHTGLIQGLGWLLTLERRVQQRLQQAGHVCPHTRRDGFELKMDGRVGIGKVLEDSSNRRPCFGVEFAWITHGLMRQLSNIAANLRKSCIGPPQFHLPGATQPCARIEVKQIPEAGPRTPR